MKGIARALVEAAIDWCRSHACSAVAVTITREGEARYSLSQFYAKFGFTPMDRMSSASSTLKDWRPEGGLKSVASCVQRVAQWHTPLLLNNLSPRNRALGYRRVVPLIGIAPIPNRGCGCPGIGGVTVAIVIATVIGSRC